MITIRKFPGWLLMMLAACTAGAAPKKDIPADNPALVQLCRDADKALQAVPGSVMEKAKTPPSGDKHDYLSLAPYWWPDPSKPDGLPWINRDGNVNPDSKVGTDHGALVLMCSQVETLSLAYYFTGREPYAAKAAEVLKVWFLDPATKMNPNLEYGQGIPGRTTGRGTGIIDTASLIRVTETIDLLAGSAAWTQEVKGGMQSWFRDYLHWMLTSKNGLDEAKAANNHGSWYLAQAASYALFTGDTAQAKKFVELGRERIASQIEPDGSQPLELKRTKSYTYTVFNLEALFILADLGRNVDVDLYGYRTADGRSLRAALDYVAPYFRADKPWPGKQVEAVKHPDEMLAGMLRRAALVYGDPKYEEIMAGSNVAASRFQLLWH